MSERDDYEIISPIPQPPRQGLSTGGWLLILVTVGIVAFSMGLVAATLANRFGRAAVQPTPMPITVNTPAAIGVGEMLTATVQPAITTTPTAMDATPSPTPTITATMTPAPTCPQAVDGQLQGGYDQALLGCATGAAGVYWAAWEPFERGFMFWRSDTHRAYALFNDGAWTPVEQGWSEGQEIPSRGDPPAGLQAPIRGFGYAWAIRDDLFNRLGWALTEEKGFCALIQPFDRGFLLQSSTVEFCQDTLYNTAREPGWMPVNIMVLDGGQWRNLAQRGAASPAAGGEIARPAVNGRFVALAATPNLDADFGDWTERWNEIGGLAQGAENYTGRQDLAGAFQAAWSAEGLYLAVRVVDDRHRAGPAGADQWQGDGLEVHLDRQLAADFANPQADGDDYQVGVTFDLDRNNLRGYRWLPGPQEGAFSPPGAVATLPDGYAAEFLLPWQLFDATSGDLAAHTFGFMLSLNDNDGDAPAQQTVLSTSPQRTTYNRPDEWGTLVLSN